MPRAIVIRPHHVERDAWVVRLGEVTHHFEKVRVRGPTHNEVDLLAAGEQPVAEDVEREATRDSGVDKPEWHRELRDDRGDESARRQQQIVLIVGNDSSRGLGRRAAPVPAHHQLAPRAEGELDERD